MTTYEQLWSDKDFIIKRINEQREYMSRVVINYRTSGMLHARYMELMTSAQFVYKKFSDRLIELS